MSKRQREPELKDTSNKRQTSLLTMFKPVAAPAKPEVDNTTAVESLNVLSTKTRDPLDLFKGVDKETIELLDLEIKTMNYEWLKILAPELVKPYFLKLKRFLKAELDAKKTIYPPMDQVYSWSNYTLPSQVKVVILGQDPYHNVNQAHGLCFSVVKGVKPPPSLVNMYKTLKIDYPEFTIPQHGYLENWAKQGVLMLNACLTVQAHNANSHKDKGWEQFTDAIIKHLNEKKANIAFMLWGSYAQKKGSNINKTKHHILKGVHPSPLSAHRGFFECGHFKKANEYLERQGRDKIDWNTL